MNKPAIRIVDTMAEDLANCNPEHILRVFGEISQLPGKAKSIRGLVFLGFPSVERDHRPNWQIPEIRKFIQKLDSNMPYFCYYLTSNPPFGFLRPYMYCLLNINEDGSVQPSEFERLVRRLEQNIREFCDRIADQPDPVIEQIMINLPARMIRNVPILRRAALRSLLPVLEIIVKEPDASDEVKVLAIQEAEELLDITVASCGSEKQFVAKAQEEANRED